MSVTVDVAVQGGRLGIPKALAEAAVRTVLRSHRVRDAVISVAFVSNRAIAGLNRRHLGRRGTTDVIAFGFVPATPSGQVVGDIYVATDVARRAARERRIPVREELVRLVVHGTLHVLGFDHPDDESRLRSEMWRRQERLVRRVLRARSA